MPKHELGEQYADFEQQEHVLRFGMWVFLASEILLFSALFAAYAFYRAMYGADFVEAIRSNTLWYGTANMYILLTSSATVALAVWAARVGRRGLLVGLLVVTAVLGLVFLGVKAAEYAKHVHEGALPGVYYHFAEHPTFGANRFYTLYWVMTGIHALHVTGGIGVLCWLTWRAIGGLYTPEHHTTLEMGTLYWHLVDIVWIVLWPLLYLA